VNVWDRPEVKGGGNLDYSDKNDDIKIDLNGRTVNVWDLRSSATYVQISIAVELLIFSCRTTGWFFLDMPSAGLIAGVFGANIIVSVCAVYGVIVSPYLDWQYVANIWAYDLAWLFVIDACKMFVNYLMGNTHDDILGYAEMPAHLTSGPDGRPSDRSSSFGNRSTTDRRPSSIAAGRASHRARTNTQSRLSSRVSMHDPAGATRASYAPRTSSLRPSVPANIARDHNGAQWGAYATSGGDIMQDAHAAASAAAQRGTEPVISKLV